MQQLGERYVQLQMVHHELLRNAFRSNEGRELRTEGDSFFCVFASALDACQAAAAAQHSFTDHPWPDGGALRVRIGLHTGEAPLMGDEYIGLDVHHAARIAAAAYGGQVLVSDATKALVAGRLPPSLTLRDLGAHRLRDLARTERLYQLVVEGVPDVFPALRTLDGTPNNLPTQLTSFVGRSDVVARAKHLIESSRLLTLTGPGGIGKTRLSLQVAAETFDQFRDGVYFVALSAVRDPEVIPSAIAQALSIPATGNRLPLDAVVDHLRNKRVLLVLDNFEQLLPEAAGFPSTLLKLSPELKVIVSSRAALRAYGEQEFPVEPLLIPDSTTHPSLETVSQFEAVKLFIERAMAAQPDFHATNENAPAIAGICERVDGLPLAIELAAARIKLFSPQALYARLEKSLDALGSGARDLPGRQQTLRGAIQWSYDMIDAPGRRLLARFSVFARGGSLEQVESVCGPPDDIGGDVIDMLDQLADQSLVRRLPDFSEPRFLMLQTIREFAAEQLEQSDEAAATKDRHVQAFIALVQQAQPYVFGSRRKEWLDRLEMEDDNLRAALDWTLATGDAKNAMLLSACLWRFWQMRGHIHEGRARVAAALALPKSRDYPVERLQALEAAGGLAYWQADMESAQRFYDECLELTRTTGDKQALANALYNAAFPNVVNMSETVRPRALLEEALPLFRELGDHASVARTLWGLGNGHYFERHYPEAKLVLEESQALFRTVDDRFGLGWSNHTHGLVSLKIGDIETARRDFLEALELFQEARDISGMVLQLDNLSQVIRADGDAATATRLASAAKVHQRSTGTGIGQLLSEQEGRTGREGLSAQDAEKLWMAGQALTLDQALEEAVAAARRSTTSDARRNG